MWGVKRKETGPSIGSGAMYGPFDETTTLENVENHDWPDPDVLDFSYVRQECQNHHENYAVYGSPWCHFFHEAADMFGQENFLVFMYTKPEIVKAAIDKIVDFEIEATRRFLDAAEGLIDITFFGNDFGTQRGLFISPELWEKFIRPVVKKFIDISHDYQCRVMLHSCGSIRDIIPALIEDGVDLLDPVQTRAKEMDLPGLLNDFGGKITFHGGIDTQHTLPFGTTQDVKNEVDSYVSQAKKHGSYILASSQEFTEDIPLQNVLEMYKPKYRNLSA
jgi:uroporphyrinogen decarboxylase